MRELEERNEIPREGNCVLVFGAPWCPQCRAMDNILPQVENLLPNVTFIHVNADDFLYLVAEYAIDSLPTCVLLKDGERISVLEEGESFDQLVGPRPDDELEHILKASFTI